MSDAEERVTQNVSSTAQPKQTAASHPAGHTEDSPTQEVTSTTLTSAGNTSATPFDCLGSSLNQSPAKETPPAGKTKARKPYTITKQREKWTEDEHALFLEALELHGRAWRRIEEHIGTKTAVQIRSHAQKFFSKLEKEQSGTVKPEGSCKSSGIDIPPPRPKRKPCHPYPRKPDQASPDSHSPTTWQASLAPGNAHLPRSFSHESLGTSAGCQPLQPTKSPFAQVQSEPSPMQGWRQQPPPEQQSNFRTRGSRPDPSNAQPQPCYPAHAPPSQEAVSAVAAAASAAAAAAAAAVIAAAGHDIQAQLQASPPKGFPFFGIPPSAFSQPGWQPNGPLQPQASQRNMPMASLDKSRSSDAGDGREGTATSEHTNANHQQGLCRAQTQPVMSACGRGSSGSHQAAGLTPQWMAPPMPLSNTGLHVSSRQGHHRQPTWGSLPSLTRPLPQDAGHASSGALPSCMPPLPAAAPFPAGVDMANPQSVYDFMSALQWWQTMGGSWLTAPPGSGRPLSGRIPGAHANHRQHTDAPQAQEQPGGSDGSDADNVRGHQGDQFGDNLLFRHMQLQRAETQDAGESARTQTRLQGAQPEGGDSNPGSEGNGSGSDGAGQCQGSGDGTGHSIHAGMQTNPAPGSTQPSGTPPPHREHAPMQAGHSSLHGQSSLHTATSQPASAMSPPHPSWMRSPPVSSGHFPMGMTPSFQPEPLLNGSAHVGQEQLKHMHASAFHAAAAAAAMATLARRAPPHSQPLPIDPLRRASSLLEQQMASGQYQPPLAVGAKEGSPSWESSAALWHPTARRPLPCGSPSLSDCQPRAGSVQPAASSVPCAAVPGQTPLRSQSTPGLADICPRRSGEKAAAPMGLPPRSFGANSGFKPYQSSHTAADVTDALPNRSSVPAEAPMKRKFSGHLAGTAPPKKRHLLQQAA